MHLFLLFLLAGCPDGSIDPSEDVDGDGFSEAQGDCDEGDASIYPGAAETCDGIDSDCDGTDGGPDVDAPSWYADTDGDGWGSDADTVAACEAPGAAWASRGGDCADDDASTHPEASEACDGVDNDCDGTTDEDQPVVYADADGDGYGDPFTPLTGCETGDGRVFDDQDCDDTDPDLNPDTVWYFDSDGDGWGLDELTDTGCESPGADYALQLGDCRPNDPNGYPGAEEICDNGNQAQNIDDNCNGLVDEGCRAVFNCEPIDTDTVWSGTLTVPCDVEVGGPTSPTLTIEEGSVIRFGPGNHLRVGALAAGSLVVDGGETGVRFIADTLSPEAGYWTGLIIDIGSGSTLTNLTVSHAGDDGAPAVEIRQDGVTIDGLRITEAAADGLEVDAVDVAITDFRAEEVTGHGLVCDVGGRMTVQDAVVQDSGSVFRTDVECAGALSGDLALTGNVRDRVDVSGLRMRESATWNALGIPYVLTQNLAIGDSDTTTRWTLGPGAVVQGELGVDIQVGAAGSGELWASGTADAPVVFESAQPIATPGDWGGLVFQDAAAVSNLTYVEVHDGGGNEVFDASVYVGGADTQVNAVSLSVLDGAADGVRVWDGSMSLINSTVSGHPGAGLAVDALGTISAPVAGTTVTGNGVSVRLGNAAAASMLEPTSSWSGNIDDAVVITDLSLEQSGSWSDLGVPFRIVSGLTVAGSDAPALTITDAVVEFEADSQLQVGMTSSRPGTLTATDAVFQGATPGAGTWNGLAIRSTGVLTGCTVRDAGANSSAAIDIYGTGTLNGVVIEDALDIGIRCWSGSVTDDLSDTTFTGVPTPFSGCD